LIETIVISITHKIRKNPKDKFNQSPESIQKQSPMCGWGFDADILRLVVIGGLTAV